MPLFDPIGHALSVNRRTFLTQSAYGLGGLALAMLQNKSLAASLAGPAGAAGDEVAVLVKQADHPGPHCAESGEGDVLRNHRCFAHLYLGLYYESLGDAAKAKMHMLKAAKDYSMDSYMGKVAQVHVKLRGW